MYLLLIVILNLSANLDAFIIGINYGIKKVKIPFINLLLISFIFFIFTFSSMICGTLIASISNRLNFNLIGSLIIVLMGLYGLFETFNDKQKEDKNYDISIKGTLSLAVLLSLNNFMVCIGAVLSGFKIFITSLFSFIICFLLLGIGNKISLSIYSKRHNKKIEIASNIIMILLGLFELIFN